MDIDLGSVERELCRIPDVRAARIVLDSDGEPSEVHVLASPGKHAKQLVRDVQSVALATSGLQIDHRIVSVVQLDDAPSAPATEAETAAARDTAPPTDNGDAVPQTADDGPASHAPPSAATPERPTAQPAVEPKQASGRIVVDGVLALRRGLNCTAEVTLRRDDEVVTGSSEGSSAASAALRLVAEATVDAICRLEAGASHVHVETAATTRVGDRYVAIVTLVLVIPPNEEVVTGSAPVRPAGEHDAVARAVLDATNRRITRSR